MLGRAEARPRRGAKDGIVGSRKATAWQKRKQILMAQSGQTVSDKLTVVPGPRKEIEERSPRIEGQSIQK